MPPILDRKPFTEALSATDLDDPGQQLADYIDQADAMLMAQVQLERIGVLSRLTLSLLGTLFQATESPVVRDLSEWVEARALIGIIEDENDVALDRLKLFERQTTEVHDRTRGNRHIA